MARRSRTPQEKKSLSLVRDRRNTYHRNDKASRKAIPAFKANTNRTHRHAAKQLLTVDDERADAKLAKVAFKGAHPIKRKAPDTALAQVVARNIEKRVVRSGGKKRRCDSAVAIGETAVMTSSSWRVNPL